MSYLEENKANGPLDMMKSQAGRTPEIARYVNQNEDLVGTSHSLLMELEKRLAPALRSTPGEVNKGEGKTGLLPQTPLGEKLSMLADAQAHDIRVLKSLLDRLEL